MESAPRQRQVAVTPKPLADGRLKYKLHVPNDSGVAWGSPRVEFRLPEGVTAVEATGGPVAEKARLLWALLDVPAGEAVTVRVLLKLEPAHAAAWATRPLPFELAYDVPPEAPPKLRLSVTAPASVALGETFPLMVRVTNLGDGAAVDRMIYVEELAESGDRLVHQGPLDPLRPGRSRTVRVDVATERAGHGEWRITAAGGPGDPAVQVVGIVAAEPSMALALDHAPLAVIGERPPIRVTMRNTGSIPLTDTVVTLTYPDLFAEAPQVWRPEAIPPHGEWRATLTPRVCLPGDGRFQLEALLGARTPAVVESTIRAAFGPLPRFIGPCLTLLTDGEEVAVPMTAIRGQRAAKPTQPLPGGPAGRGIVRLGGKLHPVQTLHADGARFVLVSTADGGIGVLLANVGEERPTAEGRAIVDVDALFA